MEVFLNSTKAPVLQVIPNSANFTVTGTLDVSVVQANKTKAEAFKLGLVS